jgi:predicted AlkP superfamily pyrophosphatase or phosphodiesterase
MRFLKTAALLLFVAAGYAASPAHKLIVVSVDGLDWRYLRDREALHLRIPNMRRLLRDGRYANGVVGVWPTITWPSHTSLITGVRPDQHGIEGNKRPKAEGGDYYWTVDLLKSPTLWKAAHEGGLKTAAVTWPVTVGASIDFNLPEYFLRRQGGSMDYAGVASKGTPGLAAEIAKTYPSFPQQWVDDRTRALAALFLLREKKPDLLLVHLVDLDSEEHDQGPYGENAKAVLERTDDLIGDLLAALPSGYDFALVSDHGFERVDKMANPRVLLAQNHVAGTVESLGGILTTTDATAAAFLRKAAADQANGIGAEISRAELLQYAPKLSKVVAAFQPAEHVLFGGADHGPYFTPPAEKGNHGFWPTRRDYRSIFCLYGPGVQQGQLQEMQLINIVGELAAVLGLPSLKQ